MLEEKALTAKLQNKIKSLEGRVADMNEAIDEQREIIEQLRKDLDTSEDKRRDLNSTIGNLQDKIV